MDTKVDYNQHLLSASETPPCEGPKLRAFPYAKDQITWIEPIDCHRDLDAPRQVYVFKVAIRSQIYALKMFKFFEPSTYREYLGPIRGRKVTDETLAYHIDPFYAECRAYATIQQAQQTNKLKRRDIAQCYGFLTLRSEFNVANLKRMLRGIKYINKHGVLNMDIHSDNYRAGLLVDFGSSWTKPYCIWSTMPTYIAKQMEGADLQRFQEMVDDEGFDSEIRAIPKYEKLTGLRPREPQ
ncbi:kinetochore Sim4 complex subunit FTA2-domain-containing protein [Xylaria cf. heliscus]|nr:kinetochore Sim4 complex subunit FTA2-domain-containing protein [Xylaria cf. heliscus]